MIDVAKPRNPLLLTAREMANVKMNDWNYFTIVKAQLKKDLGAVKEWAEHFRQLESTERHLYHQAEHTNPQGPDWHFARGRAEGYAEAAAFLEQILKNCWESSSV